MANVTGAKNDWDIFTFFFFFLITESITKDKSCKNNYFCNIGNITAISLSSWTEHFLVCDVFKEENVKSKFKLICRVSKYKNPV
jgi:hypothetical protein